jgi:hypothetical protein
MIEGFFGPVKYKIPKLSAILPEAGILDNFGASVQ